LTVRVSDEGYSNLLKWNNIHRIRSQSKDWNNLRRICS
jgi:hypothetical protein